MTYLPFASVRVNPALLEAAEGVLEQDESLSSFVEHCILMQIERRRARLDFIEHGAASRKLALISGEYVEADEVLRELDELLAQAEKKAFE